MTLMLRPIGTIMLAGALMAAALFALVTFWGALPRTPNTSPLLALFALLCACTYGVAGVLTWRRSHHAPYAFLAAVGLLLFPANYLVPGGEVFMPSSLILLGVGLAGFLYLRSAHAAAV